MTVREFTYDKKPLVDPDPTMKPDDVKALYAAQYPALTNAGVKTLPDGPNGEKRYEFTANIGRKG